MKFFVVVALLASAVAAEVSSDSLQWENFKLVHGKAYSSKIEEVRRFTIFQDNLRKIEAHNQLYQNGQKSYTMAANQFADLTSEEFSQFLNTQRSSSFNSSIPRTKFVKEIDANVPASVDWRQNNAVTEVKNQLGCGACWAFSTSGALEGVYAIKNNKLVSFSEQQLIDCATDKYGMAGCDGGQLDPAFQYMSDYGMEAESDYPYESRDGSCRYSASKVVPGSKVASFVDVPELDEDALVQAVAQHPVSVAISADLIQFYDSGIFSESDCKGFRLDHGVLTVGYGTENGVNYWIVKNSWGTGFGEQGYIRMARGVNMCNIALQPAYPVVA